MVTFLHGKKHLARLSGLAVLFIFQLSLLATPALAQELDSTGFDGKKVHYGIRVGFTESKIDLYYTQNGTLHALEQGNSSFYAPGFHLGVLVDIRMGCCFSLRVIPGMTLIHSNWESGNGTGMLVSHKVESVCGEMPVDVKFSPLHQGRFRPYLTSGLNYSFDFSTVRGDNDNESILRLNKGDFRYTCGLGVDCYTRYLKVGVELKAGFGLFAPSTSGTGYSRPYYFRNSPGFFIGINVEA